jgi:hypothetical protein
MEVESAAEVGAADRGALRCGPPAAPKVIGWVVGAVLIILAQRDLRKRRPDLVRGRVGVWKAVAIVPPGAVAYLVFGRRRAAASAPGATPDSLTA